MYWETFDVLESLVDGDAKLMVTAIRQYAQYGALPDFNGNNLLSTLWILIRPKLDADSERYERIREARIEAGRKGGLSRANNVKQNLANEANATFVKQIKPTTTPTATAETEAPAPPLAETEEGIRDNVYRDKGRPLTSPPECLHTDNSDFEKLKQQKIKEFKSTFEGR